MPIKSLTRVEERLGILLTNNCWGDNQPGVLDSPLSDKDTSLHFKVPDYHQWVVTMWHFGVDALVEYTGDKFAFTWKEGERILIRAYTKTMKDRKTRIRLERQEDPNKTFPEIIEEKLNKVL